MGLEMSLRRQHRCHCCHFMPSRAAQDASTRAQRSSRGGERGAGRRMGTQPVGARLGAAAGLPVLCNQPYARRCKPSHRRRLQRPRPPSDVDARSSHSPVECQETVLRVLIDKRATEPGSAARLAEALEHDNRVRQEGTNVHQAIALDGGTAEQQRLEDHICCARESAGESDGGIGGVG